MSRTTVQIHVGLAAVCVICGVLGFMPFTSGFIAGICLVRAMIVSRQSN